MNGEIWLPSRMDVVVSGRALLVKSFRQVIHVRDDAWVKSGDTEVAKLRAGGR